MKSHQLKFIGLQLVAGALLLSAAVRADIQREIERGLGEIVSKDLERTYGVVDDPLLTGWLDRIGQRLGNVAGRKDVKYRFKILNSDEVNAVAAPGGSIYVNRGTFQFVRSEDELAAVVGHEVGHVAGKHSMKQLNAQILTMGAVVGLKALKAETLSTFGGLAGSFALLKFTRDEENDADRRGLRNMTLCGYDGEAMMSFFRHMEATEASKPTRLEIYLQTHPPAGERLRRIGERAEISITPQNLNQFAKGLSERSLHRQSREAYRRTLIFDPQNEEAKQGILKEERSQPKLASKSTLAADEQAPQLERIGKLLAEVDAARNAIEEDNRKLTETQKAITEELEPAARDLSIAANSLNKSDTHLIRQFNRLANGFEVAARAAADLKSSRENAELAFIEMDELFKSLKSAIQLGDKLAVLPLAMISGPGGPTPDDIRKALHPVQDQLASARSGARALRLATDSLVNGLRQPLGLVGGQFDILQLQVDTAERRLRDASDGARRAMHDIASTRLAVIVNQIDFFTRSAKPDDLSSAGILSHYFGVPLEEVLAARFTQSAGSTALGIAERIGRSSSQNKKKKGTKQSQSSASSSTIQPENAVVIFRLIAADFERELK